MNRRWLKQVILAVGVLLWISSCQFLLTAPRSLDSNNVTNSRTLIQLSGWGGNPTEQRLLQQVLTQFEQQHPNIQVKFEVISDQYMDVIKTRLIGDAAPDVFYLDALEAPFLMEYPVLEPLNAYITEDFDLADFEDNLLRPFMRGEEILGLPKDYSTLALFYNQKLFADAGIDRPPTTWAELMEDAKQLTIDHNQDGRPEQYGLGMIPELARQAYKIQAFGGQVVDRQGYAQFASSAGLSGLDPLVTQYQVDRTAARPVDVGTNSGIEMFGQGKAAMVIEGCWAIPFLQETFPDLEYATAEVPFLNQQPGTMAYTVAYVMSRQSQHKPEAWELISYLTGKEGMTTWTKSGAALPSRKSVAAELQLKQDSLRSSLVAGVKYAFPWQIGKYPNAVGNHFNNQFISVMLGEQSLQPAMLKAQQNANQQIQAAQ